MTLDPGRVRTEIAGPLFSTESEGEEYQWGLHPVFSYRNDPATDLTEWDFLYPVATYNRFGPESRWHFFQLFSVSRSESMTNDLAKKRVTIFPFYFQQRSPIPEENYTALLPFYGTLKNRLFRDEIHFVMLPAYMQTRKRDVVTDNYLVPFFHVRHGTGLEGWQFWPLMGHEHKNITTRYDLWNEMETVPGHDKLFVLWPFFFHVRLGIGSDNPMDQLIVLPFYVRQRSPMRDSTSYGWPLGFTRTEDREKHYREWDAPWPLVVFARGEGKVANRIWPFYSRAATPEIETGFYLWPLYKYRRVQAEPLFRERKQVMFFLYSDLTERNTTTGTALRRTDLWPLFTARRDHAGNERLQILAPLAPLLPNNTSIERNYAPLWSVWRSEKNARTGEASQSFLWNLYRAEQSPERKKFSLLFGLFHYESGPGGRRWRLFYVPFGSGSGRGSNEMDPGLKAAFDAVRSRKGS